MSEYSLHIEDLDKQDDQVKDTVAKILEYGFDLEASAISEILSQGSGLIAKASSRAELEARYNKLLTEGAKVKIVQAADEATSSLAAIKDIGQVDFDPTDSLYESTFSEEVSPLEDNKVETPQKIEPLAFDFHSDDDQAEEEVKEPATPELTMGPEPDLKAATKVEEDDEFDLDISFDDDIKAVEEIAPPVVEDETDEYLSSFKVETAVESEVVESNEFEISFETDAASDASGDEEIVPDSATSVLETPDQSTDLGFDITLEEDADVQASVNHISSEEEAGPQSSSISEEELSAEQALPPSKVPLHERKPVALPAVLMGAQELEQEESPSDDVKPDVPLDEETIERVASSGRRRKKKGSNKMAVIIFAAIGVGSALYFLSGKNNDIENKLALKQERISHEKKVKKQERDKLAEQKAEKNQIEVSEIKREFSTRDQEGDLNIEGTIVVIDNQVKELSFTIGTPEPPPLTPEQLVEYKEKKPWMQRIVVESPGIVQAPDGKFTAAGRGRVYVDDNGERSRVLESVTIKGMIPKDAFKMPVHISMGKKPQNVDTNYHIKKLGELSYQTWFEASPTLKLMEAAQVDADATEERDFNKLAVTE